MNHHSSDFSVSSTGRISKRLESVISISIIAILLIISAILFVRQANTDMSRFGITAANMQLPQKMQPVPVVENSPAIQAPAGFEKLSDAETYTAENLYEKIDGKAPLYHRSGILEALLPAIRK